MARKKTTKTRQKQKQSQRQSVIQNVVVHLPETKKRKGRKRTRRPREPEPSPSFQPGFASLSPIVYQQVLPYPQMAVPEPTPAFKADIKRSIVEEMGLKIPRPMTKEEKKQETDLRESLLKEQSKLQDELKSARHSVDASVINQSFPPPSPKQTPLESEVYKPTEVLANKRPRPAEEEMGLPVAFQAEPTDIGVFPLLEYEGALSAVRKGDVEVPAFIPGRKRVGAEPRKSSKPKWDSSENLNRTYRKITGIIPSENTKKSALLRDIYMELTGTSPAMDSKELSNVVKKLIRDPETINQYGL